MLFHGIFNFTVGILLIPGNLLWAWIVGTYLKTTDRTVGQTNITVAFDRRKVVSSNKT